MFALARRTRRALGAAALGAGLGMTVLGGPAAAAPLAPDPIVRPDLDQLKVSEHHVAFFEELLRRCDPRVCDPPKPGVIGDLVGGGVPVVIPGPCDPTHCDPPDPVIGSVLDSRLAQPVLGGWADTAAQPLPFDAGRLHGRP